MNIPPFLEKLLLSNEAIFKNASLGLSGQNFIPVPEGKTAVILEMDIQPFFNFIQLGQEWNAGVFPANYFQDMIRRMAFQLQIVNDNYLTHFSYHNDFSIDFHEPTGGNSSLVVNMKFTGRKDDLFIYTTKGLYFNFIYPWLDNGDNIISTGMSIAYTTPDVGFTPSEQNLYEKPTTFYKSNFQDFVQTITTNGIVTDFYSPVNRNLVGGAAVPLSEYLKIKAENPLFAPNSGVSIEIPVNSGEQLPFTAFFQLPLVNIKYALINKRAADYGITQAP